MVKLGSEAVHSLMFVSLLLSGSVIANARGSFISREIQGLHIKNIGKYHNTVFEKVSSSIKSSKIITRGDLMDELIDHMVALCDDGYHNQCYDKARKSTEFVISEASPNSFSKLSLCTEKIESRLDNLYEIVYSSTKDDVTKNLDQFLKEVENHDDSSCEYLVGIIEVAVESSRLWSKVISDKNHPLRLLQAGEEIWYAEVLPQIIYAAYMAVATSLESDPFDIGGALFEAIIASINTFADDLAVYDVDDYEINRFTFPPTYQSTVVSSQDPFVDDLQDDDEFFLAGLSVDICPVQESEARTDNDKIPPNIDLIAYGRNYLAGKGADRSNAKLFSVERTGKLQGNQLACKYTGLDILFPYYCRKAEQVQTSFEFVHKSEWLDKEHRRDIGSSLPLGTLVDVVVGDTASVILGSDKKDLNLLMSYGKSSKYTDVTSQHKEGYTAFAEIRGEKHMYEVYVNSGKKLKWEKYFLEELAKLDDDSGAKTFLNAFGSHYYSEATFGVYYKSEAYIFYKEEASYSQRIEHSNEYFNGKAGRWWEYFGDRNSTKGKNATVGKNQKVAIRNQVVVGSLDTTNKYKPDPDDDESVTAECDKSFGSNENKPRIVSSRVKPIWDMTYDASYVEGLGISTSDLDNGLDYLKTFAKGVVEKFVECARKICNNHGVCVPNSDYGCEEKCVCSWLFDGRNCQETRNIKLKSPVVDKDEQRPKKGNENYPYDIDQISNIDNGMFFCGVTTYFTSSGDYRYYNTTNCEIDEGLNLKKDYWSVEKPSVLFKTTKWQDYTNSKTCEKDALLVQIKAAQVQRTWNYAWDREFTFTCAKVFYDRREYNENEKYKIVWDENTLDETGLAVMRGTKKDTLECKEGYVMVGVKQSIYRGGGWGWENDRIFNFLCGRIKLVGI